MSMQDKEEKEKFLKKFFLIRLKISKKRRGGD